MQLYLYISSSDMPTIWGNDWKSRINRATTAVPVCHGVTINNGSFGYAFSHIQADDIFTAKRAAVTSAYEAHQTADSVLTNTHRYSV